MGPPRCARSGWISPSITISACAGTSTSDVSHLTSSSGSPKRPPMIARSSSSIEPIASEPERDRRVHADGERHGQGLAARLGDLLELPEVLAEREVDRGRVAALDHQAVVRAVPRLARGILGEGDRRGQVRARVALVVDDLRQVVEVQAVAGQDDLLHGPVATDARRDRLVHRAQVRRRASPAVSRASPSRGASGSRGGW